MNEYQGPGFYYHYKHDEAKGIYDYAYEVLGRSKNTETGLKSIMYRPLYENTYLEGFEFSDRPYDMFLNDVTKDDKTFPRFTKITDPEIIAKLEAKRAEMYP